MKHVKIFGLALVVMVALSVTLTSIASAALLLFVAEQYPVMLLAHQSEANDFEIGSSKVECTTALFSSGSISGPTEEVLVHPSYSGCTAFGFVGATVKTEGCNYILHISGVVDIECETGKKIEIVASTCTVKVPAQTGLKEVGYSNIAGPPMEVNVEDKVTKIAYESNKGFGCPPNNTEEATYKGSENTEGLVPGKPSEKIGVLIT